jgi:hypothetical protein
MMRILSLRHGTILLAVAVSFGCNDVSWPSERIVTSLRILGVQAQPASVTPGQNTQLSLLCADGIGGGASDPACNNLEVAWFAHCDNPPNNDPHKCLDNYDALAAQFSSPLADTPATAEFAVAPQFDFVAPDDVLKGEISLSGQSIHYGVSYVYFAACAGRLYPVTAVSDRLPVECRDRDTNALLDQRRFVAGVTTIYSYDTIANRNPELQSPRFDGKDSFQPCSISSDCGDGFECANDSTDSTDSHCAPVISHCADAASCSGHCLDFQVPSSSFTLFTLDGAPISNPLKSLWAETYANGGGLPDDARFALPAPEPNTDTMRSSCAPWQAPPMATDQARLWIVVRDDRGGLSWLSQRILVR